MRICDYHKQDNKSVLDLPTPLELYKMGHTAEEYDELVSFYSSDASPPEPRVFPYGLLVRCFDTAVDKRF